MTTGNAYRLEISEDTYTNNTGVITNKRVNLNKRLKIANHETEAPLWNKGERIGFMKFNIENLYQILDEEDILHARLKLFAAEVVKGGVFTLYKVRGQWSENSLNANNLPALGEKILQFSIPDGASAQWISLDVTGLVKEWISIPELHTSGFAIRVEKVGVETGHVMFGSKESVFTTFKRNTPKNGSRDLTNGLRLNVYNGPTGYPAYINLILDTSEKD